MLQTSRRTPSPPPPLGRPLQLHELPSSHRPVLWPRTVGSSTAGQTCDDQDGAARGESRPCAPQGKPLLLRFLPGAGDSQADIVGRGHSGVGGQLVPPHTPAPHAGPEVGLEEPAGEAPDRSWALRPCAGLRMPLSPVHVRAGRKPRPVLPASPSGARHQTVPSGSC